MLHDSACFGPHYLIFVVQRLERALKKEKELSQIPRSRTRFLIGVSASKLNRSFTRPEMTFTWIIDHSDVVQKWADIR
jgi:hypothetical protein